MSEKKMELLSIENIDVYYDHFPVLEGVSIKVNEGEIVAVIGGNGSGKTTLLKTISGLIRPRKGKIKFCSYTINGQVPHEIVESGLIHIPSGRKLFTTLTLQENLQLGAYAKRAKKEKEKTLKRVYELFPILEEKAFSLAGSLSGGEQQMLAIGRGLMSLPRLLMLDEPSMGLGTKIVAQIFQVITDLNQEGISILVIEHDISRVLGIADRGYILTNGKILIEGTGVELLDNEQTKKAYLGLGIEDPKKNSA